MLSGTRPVAAAIAPITYAEIEAFNRATCAALSPWDVLLIRHVDDAVRAIALGAKPKPTSISDTKAALRAVIAARAKRESKAA